MPFPIDTYKKYNNSTTGSDSSFFYFKRFCLFHFSSSVMRRMLPTVSQPGFFNLTSTFRSDSDFLLPYFHTQVRDSPCENCLPNSTTVIFNKTKLMVWIVSNCKTQSKREEYMDELSKYIKVDVFGKCGNSTPDCPRMQRNCTKRLIESYKFYFAVENSICKDYFTGEKQ